LIETEEEEEKEEEEEEGEDACLLSVFANSREGTKVVAELGEDLRTIQYIDTEECLLSTSLCSATLIVSSAILVVKEGRKELSRICFNAKFLLRFEGVSMMDF
jgi:hypothetical protein